MIDVGFLKNNSDKLKNDFLFYLKEYLTEAQLSEKIINTITDSFFIEKNPIYYTYYPYLFSEGFDFTENDITKKLNIVGFLYYKSVLTIDSIFDNKESKNFDQYMIASFCQEEAIKILTEIFIDKPIFWKYWNLRKTEYAKAYKLDKMTKSLQSFEEYENLADFKCAFGKIAIDSLYVLTDCKNENFYQQLLKSHKYFYTAFQIIDDIKDIDEDLKNDQFNIAVYSLANKLSEKTVQNYDSKTIRSKVYTEGVAEELYKKAHEYILKSKHEVQYLKGIDQWLFEIQSLNNSIIKGSLNIEGFFKVFSTNSVLSNEFVENNDLDKAIHQSIAFIEKYQCKDGYWRDYFNDGGNSDQWATGFVLSNSSEIISKEKIKIAIKNLESNFSDKKLWGYNSRWISDADSTTFVLLGLTKNNIEIPKKIIQKWLKFQNLDGGFRTYICENEVLVSLQSKFVTNAKGWMESHFCVSATAFYFLSIAKIYNEEFVNLREYLVKEIKDLTVNSCYWWSNSIYALYYIHKGTLENNDKELLSLVENSLEFIMKNEGVAIVSNKFYEALLIEIICSSEYLFKEYYGEISLKVKNLTDNQFDDGSWISSQSMRIPHPEISKNNLNSENWPCKDSGTNIIVKDFHRIFTTVACNSALISYKKALKANSFDIQ